MFISFEGVDGTGKTTIIKDIQKKLDNTHYYNEPNNQFGQISKFGMDGFNKVDLLYMWWASRKFELNRCPSNKIILADRYYDSTYVYLNNHINEPIISHNYDPQYFRKPEITFIFSASLDTIIERTKNRNAKKDVFENHNKIIEREMLFDELWSLPQNNDRRFEYINTNIKSIEQISDYCINIIKKFATGTV